MAWQGIPFRLPFEHSDLLSVALSSIPKIIIESPADLKGPLLTAVAALLGGLIPALIAWKTYKANAKQLQEDRALQQQSIEADRDSQQLIAERNFNLQVLSNNRQIWIKELRNLISEVCVYGFEKFEIAYDVTCAAKALKDFEPFLASNANSTGALEEYKKRSDLFQSKALEARVANKKFDLLVHKIDLMLNPSELISTSIMARIYTIRACGGKIEDPNYGYSKAYDMLSTEVDKLIKLTQKCLKTEWEKVKRAE